MTDLTSLLPPGTDDALVRDFMQLVADTDTGDPAPSDIQALRHMLNQHPQLWRLAGDLAYTAALNLIHKLDARPAIAESLKRGWAAMKDEFGYAAAPPLERLLIEQVVLCWFHFNLVDMEYTSVMGQSLSPSTGDHWERRLSAAQRRYLRACEALARIRKLARSTPALQVNIAADGGQQINVLGGDLSEP
jgi:hypothetical protein